MFDYDVVFVIFSQSASIITVFCRHLLYWPIRCQNKTITVNMVYGAGLMYMKYDCAIRVLTFKTINFYNDVTFIYKYVCLCSKLDFLFSCFFLFIFFLWLSILCDIQCVHGIVIELCWLCQKLNMCNKYPLELCSSWTFVQHEVQRFFFFFS